jgi:predicted Zn-dependent protease
VPGSARLHAMRAAIRAQLGDFENAQADFEQAARLDPAEPGGPVGLSLTMQQTGRLEESIELLREQVRQRPHDPAINLLLAQALVRQSLAPDAPELVEARQALLRTIEAEPGLARARVELGKLYLRTGDDDKAIDQLRGAVALDPSDRRATYQLLLALRRVGRMEETQPLVERLRAIMEQERQAEAERNRTRLVKAAPAGPGD